MRIFIGSVIIMVLLSGCRGHYPSALLTTPPSSLPMRHKRSAPAFRENIPFPRSDKSTTYGLDYTSGQVTYAGTYLHLFRPQVTFATVDDDSTSISRSALGVMGLAGMYRGRAWVTSDRYDTLFRNFPILGFAGYYDGNIGLAGSAVALGIGWNCMLALEDGGYHVIWRRHSNWPIFVAPQVGAYIFMDADISSKSGFWVRGGLMMPTSLYVDGGISWGQFSGTFGASMLKETSPRYTAGIHYQIP